MDIKHLPLLLIVFGAISCGRNESKDKASNTIVSDSNAVQNDTSLNDSVVSIIDTSKFGKYQRYLLLDLYLTKTRLDTAEFLLIDSTCAIFINPTSVQIDQMEKEYGEEDFYTIADDNQYYHHLANALLDSLGVETISIGEDKHLRLIGKNNSEWTLDIRQDGAPGWNLIFFNTNKEPKIFSTIDVNEEVIDSYFKK